MGVFPFIRRSAEKFGTSLTPRSRSLSTIPPPRPDHPWALRIPLVGRLGCAWAHGGACAMSADRRLRWRTRLGRRSSKGLAILSRLGTTSTSTTLCRPLLAFAWKMWLPFPPKMDFSDLFPSEQKNLNRVPWLGRTALCVPLPAMTDKDEHL